MSVRTITLFGLLFAAGLACRERLPPDPGEVPVVELTPKAEGEAPIRISRGEYKAALARLRLQRESSMYAKRLPKALREHVLDELVEHRLLAAAAERLGVSASTTAVARELAATRAAYEPGELERQLAESYQTEDDLAASIRDRLTAQAVLEAAAFEDLEVTDAELNAAWAALPKSERTEPERVHAAQIVLSTEEDAKAAKRALGQGQDFAEVARAVSIAPEAARGGDLGWFAEGEMPQVFDRACFPLEVGAVSRVTPSQFGFHICTVLERAPERALSLEDLKDTLRERLLTEKRREAKARFLEALEDRYEVVRRAPPEPKE